MCGKLLGLACGNRSCVVARESISMYRADGRRGPWVYSSAGVRN